VHHVGSYYTNISRCTVHKTLNKYIKKVPPGKMLESLPYQPTSSLSA